MKRIQLFEFEDFSWLPHTIRSGITNLLKVLHRITGTAELVADLVRECRKKADFDQIVDLGSGSGGPMPEVLKIINNENAEGKPLKLLLSDKYPSAETLKRINDLKLPNVQYLSQSVDASEIEQSPAGLKTMIASFHHMPPTVARQIIQSARKNKAPLLIYEIAENNIPLIVWWLLLPLSLAILFLMALIMTPFVRPLSASQLIFTYLIPIIPLIYAWDGQASLVRTYSFKDIENLTGDHKDGNYVWELAQAKKRNGKKAGYYLFGYPAS